MQEMKSKENKMNKEEILQEIEKTKKHLYNMQNMLEECGYKRWKPKYDDRYYYVSEECTAMESRAWAEYIVDERYRRYNVFKTEEEAKQEAEKILVRRQLEDIARRLNRGERIDWDNYEQAKYCIELYKNNIITNFYKAHKTQGTVYCLDRNFKDVAIQEIREERLKAYLRGE